MLIDKNGKIVFKGHPANRPDLEKDLDALLKGETLTGEGCASDEANGEKAKAVPEGFKKLDMELVNKECTELHELFEGFTKDEELTKEASSLMRAFCVIVL